MGMGIAVMFLGLVFLVAIVALVVWALIRFLPDPRGRSSGGSGRREGEETAEEALRRRFARGEIDAGEYERSLKVLEGERNGTRSGI